MVIIRGQYASLSRGRHSAKHMESGDWASRDDDGDLILGRDGRWMIHTSDGFCRRQTVYIVIRDGKLVGGVGSRFSVVG